MDRLVGSPLDRRSDAAGRSGPGRVSGRGAPLSVGLQRRPDSSAATTASPGAIAAWQHSIGNASVSAFLAAGGSAVVVQREGAKPGPVGALVHPSSGLSAQKIVQMLKHNKKVPDFLKKSLTVREGAIALTKPLPVTPAGTLSDFLEPYIDALTSPDWEITTAASTIEVTGTGTGQQFKQIVTPDLGKSEHLGSTHKTGPGETSFLADTLFSTSKEVIFGMTVGADDTEQLKTGRGLIVIVTRITVTAPGGQKKTFTPNEDEVLESVIHEISAHAGRASEHKPDTHGTPVVDQIADEVAQFFRSSEKSNDVTPRATFDAIANFLGMTAESAPPPGPKGAATTPKP